MYNKMFEYILPVLAMYLAYSCSAREKIDFEKVETVCRQQTLPECMNVVERTRRVTWRFGVLGALCTSMMLLAMGVVNTSNWIHVTLASWIVITSCMNFRAYHVEDELTNALKKTLKD